jgi:outer membrane lipoprotein-sorting protein
MVQRRDTEFGRIGDGIRSFTTTPAKRNGSGMGLMKTKKWMLIAMLAFVAPVLHAANGDLERVLQQMNAGAAKFQSFQADVNWVTYQAVVQESDVQKGSFAYQKKGANIFMAIRIKTEDDKPSPKDLLFRDNELKFYQPMIRQLTVFSATGNQAQFETFLTLGFGASGDDLQKNWDITYQGTEQINNVQVAKLDLKPKQDAVKRTFSHVTIWVDSVRSLNLKQQFFEPSGDYRTMTYSDIRYNQPIKKDIFELKIAPGTQTVRK